MKNEKIEKKCQKHNLILDIVWHWEDNEGNERVSKGCRKCFEAATKEIRMKHNLK